MPHPFYQQDQQIRTIASQNEYEQSLGLAQAQKEPDKMQTGSFNAVGEGLDSSLGNMADMRNVTAMLFRAMNYKGAGGKEAAAVDKSVGDGHESFTVEFDYVFHTIITGVSLTVKNR